MMEIQIGNRVIEILVNRPVAEIAISGARGPQGIEGPQGPQGEQGPQGPPLPLSGTQYIYVYANGTPAENGAELKAAYLTAQSMNPSSSNRIQVVLGTGTYFDAIDDEFVFNQEYIDITSLTSEPDAELTSKVVIESENIRITGIKCLVEGAFDIRVDDKNNIYKNCIAGDVGFNSSNAQSLKGTYINCVAGDASFGRGGTLEGTFTNCVGGNGSFAVSGTIQSTAKLFYCRLTDGGFQTPEDGAIVKNCINGDGSHAIFTYTVADLPTSPVLGDVAYVNDAFEDKYNKVVTGGGTVFITVFFNGTNWVCR